MLSDKLLEEIEAGQAETLTRAARRLPRSRQDRPVTLSCLLRWVLNGVKGPNGQTVHLEAARLAGKWVTTPGAMRRFVESQNLRIDAEPPPMPRSPTKRRRAAELASKELERHGI